MPRKPMNYISDFPYHVTARSNNQDWFYISKQKLFELFAIELQTIKNKFGARIHAFVLMDNHYHLLLSTKEEYNLGVVMQKLQRSISSQVNKEADRINHVFGGPYKGSLITDPNHYASVLKYVYRNPVKAGIVSRVEEYFFSTLYSDSDLFVEDTTNGISTRVPEKKDKLLDWLNSPHTSEQNKYISSGLKRTKFSLATRSSKHFVHE
jgi:putative transposase